MSNDLMCAWKKFLLGVYLKKLWDPDNYNVLLMSKYPMILCRIPGYLSRNDIESKDRRLDWLEEVGYPLEKQSFQLWSYLDEKFTAFWKYSALKSRLWWTCLLGGQSSVSWWF